MEQLYTCNWEEEHSHLHAVVDHLQSKPNLTVDEQVQLTDSKKKRLQAKDRLIELGLL